MVTPATLLLVDDDRPTLEVFAQLLSEAGYRVLTADSFERAVHILKNAKPELLIVDVRLGNFNGLQLIATSSQQARSLVVTGFADPVIERDARRLGAEFLVKPLSRSQLLSMVGRLLESTTPAGPPRRWVRKRLASVVPITAGSFPGRLVDVSPGGMRIELTMDSADDLPSTLALTLPGSDRTIQVGVIRKLSQGNCAWLCGAEVPEEDTAATSAWRALIDTLP